MNVSLTEEQERYIAAKVATGRYRSAAEVVREALRCLMDRENDERRRAQVWREEVRRKIDEGFEEAMRGELLDGEQVLERLRQRIESRGKKGA